MTSHIYMLVGAKVCDLTEDLLWFVCGNFDVFPNKGLIQKKISIIIITLYIYVYFSLSIYYQLKSLHILTGIITVRSIMYAFSVNYSPVTSCHTVPSIVPSIY